MDSLAKLTPRLCVLVVLLLFSGAAFATWSDFADCEDAHAQCLLKVQQSGGTCGGPYHDNNGNYYEWDAAGGYLNGWIGYRYASCVPFDCSRLTNPTDSAYIAPFTASPSLAFSSDANRCIGGCTWSPQSSPRVTTTVNGAVAGFRGFFYPSGGSCATPTSKTLQIPPPSDPNVCITYASGQKMCIRGDQYCYTLTTGREMCWNSTQTGNKTDGPINQQQVAGSSTGTPPPPPTGDSLSQTGASATTQTSTTPTTYTTTTTTTNYITVNGTNAGTTDSGQPTGTTPSSTPSTGSSSSAASGGSCSASYTCSSSNGVECAMLEEQRKARCSIESEKAGVTGGTTCTTPPACSGAKCDADAYHSILQAWKTRCAVESSNTKLDGIASAIASTNTAIGTGNGKLDTLHTDLSDLGTVAASINSALHSDGGTPDGDSDAELGSAGTAEAQGFGADDTVDDTDLDETGFGLPRTCPSPPTFALGGHTFTFDMTYICFSPSIESLLLLLLVGIYCLFYIARD